jgi:hypothetical protein
MERAKILHLRACSVMAAARPWWPARLAVEIHLKLRKGLGERVALGLAVVIAAEDRGDTLFERRGGFGDDILVALHQHDSHAIAGPTINGADLVDAQTC